MLDLRGTQSSSQPSTPAAAGVPNVGSNDVSFAPQPRRSSPILESGSAAPANNSIHGVTATKQDPAVPIIAVVCVAIAGAAGLLASYLVTQEQTKQLAANDKFQELTTQLTTGDTGKNLQLIKTTAAQAQVLTAAVQDTPWVSLLDAMSGEVPGAVQLKNATFDSQTKLLSLIGSGGSYDDVAHLMAALESSDRFSGVTLQSASSSQLDATVRTDFSMSVTYVPKPAAAPQTATPSAC